MKNLDQDALETGPSYQFAAWPIDAVPQIAAGVYTVWRGDDLLYVGMAGRSLTHADIEAKRNAPDPKPAGLFNRLKSHASGRRSGDQFCVYVCDTFVVPSLTSDDLATLSSGQPLLDGKTKGWIRNNCRFRIVETVDGKAALSLENEVQNGGLSFGPPLLNGKPAS